MAKRGRRPALRNKGVKQPNKEQPKLKKAMVKQQDDEMMDFKGWGRK